MDDGDPDEAVTPRLLHVHNGDCAADVMREADVTGDIAVYGDVLYEGPCPLDASPAEWIEARAQWAAARGYAPLADARRMVAAWSRALDSWAAHDEVVLWFEHDLHDQAQLARHLDWIARVGMPADRVSMICIGDYPDGTPPGAPRFIGLGQLSPHQMASLAGTRAPLGAAQIALGRRAWRALAGGDVEAAHALAEAGTPELPCLGPALRRWLEELPSTRGGLPRTERQTLVALVARGGAASPTTLFQASQDAEAAPFMGDTLWWRRVLDLAAGARPLVRVEVAAGSGAGLPAGKVALTDAGRAALAGTLDWIATAQPDRWIGGVRVADGRCAWRWDAERRRPVAG